MKKFLLLQFVLAMTVLTAEANIGVKVFDVPVEKGALKEVVNKQHVKPEEIKQTVQQPKDIVVENINGKVLYNYSYDLSLTSVNNELTSTEITFVAYSLADYVSKEYYWIAIA